MLPYNHELDAGAPTSDLVRQRSEALQARIAARRAAGGAAVVPASALPPTLNIQPDELMPPLRPDQSSDGATGHILVHGRKIPVTDTPRRASQVGNSPASSSMGSYNASNASSPSSSAAAKPLAVQASPTSAFSSASTGSPQHPPLPQRSLSNPSVDQLREQTLLSAYGGGTGGGRGVSANGTKSTRSASDTNTKPMSASKRHTKGAASSSSSSSSSSGRMVLRAQPTDDAYDHISSADEDPSSSGDERIPHNEEPSRQVAFAASVKSALPPKAVKKSHIPLRNKYNDTATEDEAAERDSIGQQQHHSRAQSASVLARSLGDPLSSSSKQQQQQRRGKDFVTETDSATPTRRTEVVSEIEQGHQQIVGGGGGKKSAGKQQQQQKRVEFPNADADEVPSTLRPPVSSHQHSFSSGGSVFDEMTWQTPPMSSSSSSTSSDVSGSTTPLSPPIMAGVQRSSSAAASASTNAQTVKSSTAASQSSSSASALVTGSPKPGPSASASSSSPPVVSSSSSKSRRPFYSYTSAPASGSQSPYVDPDLFGSTPTPTSSRGMLEAPQMMLPPAGGGGGEMLKDLLAEAGLAKKMKPLAVSSLPSSTSSAATTPNTTTAPSTPSASGVPVIKSLPAAASSTAAVKSVVTPSPSSSSSSSALSLPIIKTPPVDDQCPRFPTTRVYSDPTHPGAFYDCFLVLNDIPANINKFYLLQVLESDLPVAKESARTYFLWARWGRRGTSGRNSLVEFTSNGTNNNPAAEAVKAFETKFREKTRQQWAFRATFQPVQAKYNMIYPPREPTKEAQEKMNLQYQQQQQQQAAKEKPTKETTTPAAAAQPAMSQTQPASTLSKDLKSTPANSSTTASPAPSPSNANSKASAAPSPSAGGGRGGDAVPAPISSKLRRTVSESDSSGVNARSKAAVLALQAAVSSLPAGTPDLFGSLPSFSKAQNSFQTTVEPVPAATVLGLTPTNASSSGASSAVDTRPLDPLLYPARHPQEDLWLNLMHHLRVVTPPWKVPVPTFAVSRMEELRKKTLKKEPPQQQQQQQQHQQQQLPSKKKSVSPLPPAQTASKKPPTPNSSASLSAADRATPPPPMTWQQFRESVKGEGLTQSQIGREWEEYKRKVHTGELQTSVTPTAAPTTPAVVPPTPTAATTEDLPSTVPTQAISTWPVPLVSQFLRSLGSAFHAHAVAFAEADLDGRQLLVLDDSDLIDLGVNGKPSSKVQRKTILRAIKERMDREQEENAEKQQQQQQQQQGKGETTLSPATPVSTLSTLTPTSTSPPSMPQGVSILRASSLSGITRLGAGNFGVTYRAVWRANAQANPVDVVIKVPRTRSGADEWNELLAFLEVPAHRNVLPLIGICTDFPAHLVPPEESIGGGGGGAAKKGQTTCCFVTLYMARGSLKDLLVSADLCTRLLGGDILDTQLHTAPPGSYQSGVWKSVLHRSTRLLLEIASGLAHLHAHGILHRDIASRNVLVNAQGDALVSDFGLSRKITPGAAIKDARSMHAEDLGPDTTGATTGYYRLAQPEQTALPLRWMSAESLCEYLFTTASDVWMFGVCAWEVFTRAQSIPYSDLSTYNQLMAKVGGGSRTLTLPSYVPPRLSDLIQRCWLYEGRSRPNMTQIASELRAILREQAEEMAPGLAGGLIEDELGDDYAILSSDSTGQRSFPPSSTGLETPLELGTGGLVRMSPPSSGSTTTFGSVTSVSASPPITSSSSTSTIEVNSFASSVTGVKGGQMTKSGVQKTSMVQSEPFSPAMANGSDAAVAAAAAASGVHSQQRFEYPRVSNNFATPPLPSTEVVRRAPNTFTSQSGYPAASMMMSQQGYPTAVTSQSGYPVFMGNSAGGYSGGMMSQQGYSPASAFHQTSSKSSALVQVAPIGHSSSSPASSSSIDSPSLRVLSSYDLLTSGALTVAPAASLALAVDAAEMAQEHEHARQALIGEEEMERQQKRREEHLLVNRGKQIPPQKAQWKPNPPSSSSFQLAIETVDDDSPPKQSQPSKKIDSSEHKSSSRADNDGEDDDEGTNDVARRAEREWKKQTDQAFEAQQETIVLAADNVVASGNHITKQSGIPMMKKSAPPPSKSNANLQSKVASPSSSVASLLSSAALILPPANGSASKSGASLPQQQKASKPSFIDRINPFKKSTS